VFKIVISVLCSSPLANCKLKPKSKNIPIHLTNIFGLDKKHKPRVVYNYPKNDLGPLKLARATVCGNIFMFWYIKCSMVCLNDLLTIIDIINMFVGYEC